MAAAGMALAFGSDSPVTAVDPWGGVQAAAFHQEAEQRISAGAAFAAHTRGAPPRRAGDGDGHEQAGVLVPGAAADLAVWEATELVVQAPDDRIPAWSTDPRSRGPGLPDLSPGRPAPRGLRTVVVERVVHDAGGLGGTTRGGPAAGGTGGRRPAGARAGRSGRPRRNVVVWAWRTGRRWP